MPLKLTILGWGKFYENLKVLRFLRSFSDTLSEPQKSIARSETALELERESRTSPDSLQSLNSLDLECPIDFEIKVNFPL